MASQALIMNQINRLKSRFGDKAFDSEFVILAAREFAPMAEGNVIRAVDVWVGNRPANRPPLITDFRDARLAEAKVRVDYAATEAMRGFERGPKGSIESFRRIMRPLVGHVESVAEAIEIRKHQIRIEKAKNPNYDPMTDPKWMGPQEPA